MERYNVLIGIKLTHLKKISKKLKKLLAYSDSEYKDNQFSYFKFNFIPFSYPNELMELLNYQFGFYIKVPNDFHQRTHKLGCWHGCGITVVRRKKSLESFRLSRSIKLVRGEYYQKNYL